MLTAIILAVTVLVFLVTTTILRRELRIARAETRFRCSQAHDADQALAVERTARAVAEGNVRKLLDQIEAARLRRSKPKGSLRQGACKYCGATVCLTKANEPHRRFHTDVECGVNRARAARTAKPFDSGRADSAPVTL